MCKGRTMLSLNKRQTLALLLRGFDDCVKLYLFQQLLLARKHSLYTL